MPHKEENNINHNLHNDIYKNKLDNIVISHKEKNNNHNKGNDIFSSLPNEIYYKIFENIKVTDLAAVTMANKRIYELLKDDYVWQLMCQSQYPKKRILEAKKDIVSDAIVRKDIERTRKINRKRNGKRWGGREEHFGGVKFVKDSKGRIKHEEDHEVEEREEVVEEEEEEENSEEEADRNEQKEQNEIDSLKNNNISWKDVYKYLTNPICYMAKEREIYWLDRSERHFNRHHWNTVIYPESDYGKVVRLNYVWLFKVTAKLRCVQPGNYDIIWKFRVNKNLCAGLTNLNFETRLLYYSYEDEEEEEEKGITRKEKKRRESEREIKVSGKRELPDPKLFKEMLSKDDWGEHYLHHQIVVPERRDEDGKNSWYNVECKIYNDDERYQKRGLWIDYVKLRHRKE